MLRNVNIVIKFFNLSEYFTFEYNIQNLEKKNY